MGRRRRTGAGRADGGSHRMRLPQAGQAAASSRQRWPVPTQHLAVPAGSAAHTTRGSSTLATTVVAGSASSILRHARAWRRTSPMRSSWSRLRLSSTTTVGLHRLDRLGQQALVDLEGHDRRPAARRTGRRPARGAGWRRRRWSPPAPGWTGRRPAAGWWWSCRWCPRRGPTWWPAAICSRAGGSTASVTRPPMTEPAPRPARRETSETTRPARAATRVRRGRSTGQIFAQNAASLNHGDGRGRAAG